MIDFRKFNHAALLAGVALSAVVFATPALAQTAEPNTDAQNEQAEEEQEQAEGERREEAIVVTGSRIRRDDFSGSSPVTIITSDTFAAEGLIDTAAILQSSSIAAGRQQITSQFGGFVVEGGTGVNAISLRGLGAERTLVLLNGRRLGGAGTRGQVGAVDLNTIPSSIIDRIEILKDGASSVYGSDAVAGVVNIITRNEIDRPEVSVSLNVPFAGARESYAIDAGYGWNFDNGNILVSASYDSAEALMQGDRDYLSCPDDYVFDPVTGVQVGDRETNPGHPNFGNFKCFNSLNDAIDRITTTGGVGTRWVRDPTVTGGLIPGFRPRASATESNTDDYRQRQQDVFPKNSRASIFATAEFDVNGVELFGEALFNRRETESRRFRQFFPEIPVSNAFNPFAGQAGTRGGRSIVLAPFNQDIVVDYGALTAGARGDFGGMLDTWTWDANVSYTTSSGEYAGNIFVATNVEDSQDRRINPDGSFGPVLGPVTTRGTDGVVRCVMPNGSSCPIINYFDPRFVAGNWTQEELNFLTTTETGKTEYDQLLFQASATGDVIKLPAGALAVAVGVEARKIEINDVPGFNAQNRTSWGLTTAGITKGEDTITEVFAEVEIPLLKGLPFVESLTANLSGRAFDYETSGDDSVYKYGINWQVTPSVRFRHTSGTSYRGPALYELFLSPQTAFAGQLAIDPCIEWGESGNENLRINCASQGIPADYQGAGSSALVLTGGNRESLTAETSDAKTFGVEFTPSGLDMRLALDYFSIEVNNQIAQFGAAGIIGACYAEQPDRFATSGFCRLFERDLTGATGAQFQILSVTNGYVNISRQIQEGLDLQFSYGQEFDFGELALDAEATWTFKDESQLFNDPDIPDSEETDDNNGLLGSPDFVGNSQVRFTRGDWDFYWNSDFVGRNSNDELNGGDTFSETRRKYYAEFTAYHGVSVRRRFDDLEIRAGISNLFDEAPPSVSFGQPARAGRSAILVTQYDLVGRSGFINISKRF